MVTSYKQEYVIRNYSEADAEKIGMFDKVAELSYRYNPDFSPADIFCAVDPAGSILGVGHLEPHDTWHLADRDGLPPDFIHKLVLRLSLNPQFQQPENIKGDLVQSLLQRAEEIKQQYPGRKIRVFSWIYSDDYNEIDFYLSQGFLSYRNSLVMKYDLSREIPELPVPENVRLARRSLQSDEELKQLHEAESAAFSGIAWSMNLLRWYRGAPEWISFSAFSGDDLIGNVMTWFITGERSAVENIFVVPGWRNRGIAGYMTIEALRYLKTAGKSIATLSVYGDNGKAISLYRKLGFEMVGIMIEFGYDL